MGMARVAIAVLLVFNMIIINPKLTVAQYPLPDLPVVDNISNPKQQAPNIPNPKLQAPNNLPGPYGMGSQPQKKEPQEGVAQQKPAEEHQHQPNEQPHAFNMDKLQENFYGQSCPRADEIVANAVFDLYKKDPQSIAILLRLQFHDCFVGGCDASILLDSTETLEKVEKSAAANGLLLRGADLIDDIKNMLEQECPETVSCADTLAFAAHEARVLAGLPRVPQLGGRRDSMISLATNVDIPNSLPLPFWDLDQMLELFQRKGFSAEDMVVLIGAHSIGGAHCEVIRERTFNFKNTNKPDPLFEPGFLRELQGMCKLPGPGALPTPGEIVNFDATPTVLDNLFYKTLLEKKALLNTDQRLVHDPRTAPLVQKLADDPELFTKMFAEAITRMATLNVITGETGQVRRTCRSTN